MSKVSSGGELKSQSTPIEVKRVLPKNSFEREWLNFRG